MVAVLQPLSPGKRKAPRQFQEFQDRWRVLTRAAKEAGPHRRGKERCELRMMPPTVEERLQPDVAANATDTQFGLAALRDTHDAAWRFYAYAPRLRTGAQMRHVTRQPLWAEAGAGGDGAHAAGPACLHLASQHLFAHYGDVEDLGLKRVRNAAGGGDDCHGRGGSCRGGHQERNTDYAACRKNTPLALHLSGFGVRSSRPLVLQLVAHAEGRASSTPMPLPSPQSSPLAGLATASAAWIVAPALSQWWPPILQSRVVFEATMLRIVHVVRRRPRRRTSPPATTAPAYIRPPRRPPT